MLGEHVGGSRFGLASETKELGDLKPCRSRRSCAYKERCQYGEEHKPDYAERSDSYSEGPGRKRVRVGAQRGFLQTRVGALIHAPSKRRRYKAGKITSAREVTGCSMSRGFTKELI